MAEPPEYRVHLTDAVRLQFSVLQRRAMLFGVRDRVLAALEVIDRQLRSNPREWGRSEFHLSRDADDIAHRVS